MQCSMPQWTSYNVHNVARMLVVNVMLLPACHEMIWYNMIPSKWKQAKNSFILEMVERCEQKPYRVLKLWFSGHFAYMYANSACDTEYKYNKSLWCLNAQFQHVLKVHYVMQSMTLDLQRVLQVCIHNYNTNNGLWYKFWVHDHINDNAKWCNVQ